MAKVCCGQLGQAELVKRALQPAWLGLGALVAVVEAVNTPTSPERLIPHLH